MSRSSSTTSTVSPPAGASLTGGLVPRPARERTLHPWFAQHRSCFAHGRNLGRRPVPGFPDATGGGGGRLGAEDGAAGDEDGGSGLGDDRRRPLVDAAVDLDGD